MTIWVLLLRGVNVGGTGRLPMAALRALLGRLGCTQVETYIQSGNAVFRSDRAAGDLAAAVGAAIAAEFGFRPAVILREAGQIAATLAANPFPQGAENPKSVHFFFLAEPARGADIGALDALAARGEAFHLTDAVFYLFAPEGVGHSALADRAPRVLGVPVTARNLRTVAALDDMARRLAATEA
ncbi:MAG: DUF1697 domain-containing protein [Phaeovulum sp.]|uniref:DUF1697 domain-containing protein n=1 Tax=Phaeovulum sp. TaxID=2934796 RepID=UPI0027372058|nr:DUF1697 domain-containing protein [Phaeovulum sp.]MDP3860829.1 DUF1697 domain-containing protein [Phaeovulum sp.]